MLAVKVILYECGSTPPASTKRYISQIIMYKYNYVLFNQSDNKLKKDNDGYYTICAKDLEDKEQTRVVPFPMDKKPFWMRLLFVLHTSQKIAKHIKLPLQSLWYPLYFIDDFSHQRPLCFIVLSRELPLGYLKYLKNKYKDCRIVHMHRDFLDVGKRMRPDLHLNPIFDLEMTYDEMEANKYNIPHFDEFESAVDIHRDKEFESDVFFAGKAKDRFPLLLKAYKKFTCAGLNVFFYLTHVPKSEQVELPGIVYSDKVMPYREMLYHSVNTRCMLEITQSNQQGYTSRFLEAVIYGKKLITNSCYITQSKFYDETKMQVVEDMDNINTDFITEGSGFVDYNYKNEFSPIHMINRVEEELNKRF